MNKQQQSVIDAEDTVRRVMGNHPQDILASMRNAADTLLHIGEVFRLMEEDLAHGNTEAIYRRINVCQYLAQSAGAYMDDMRDKAVDAMHAAGLETLDEREAQS